MVDPCTSASVPESAGHKNRPVTKGTDRPTQKVPSVSSPENLNWNLIGPSAIYFVLPIRFQL